jgi:hypothetical protein
MRHLDGKWLCAECGAVLHVADGDEPKVTIHAASGKPNVRVLMLRGVEIHRCEIKGR